MGFLFSTVATAGSATGGVADAVSVFGQIWSMITGNPALMIFIGVAILTAVIGLFKTLFDSVKA